MNEIFKYRKIWWLVIMTIVTMVLSGCKIYKRDIILRNETVADLALISQTIKTSDENYVLSVNDWITVKIETDKGEKLVDPNGEYMRDIMLNSAMSKNNTGVINMMTGPNQIQYLIKSNGYAYLPIIGEVYLAGLTYAMADSLLAKLYSNIYDDPMVVCRALNRRCFVLGATNTTVSMPNERIHLFEVLAAIDGLPIYSKLGEIKIIRGFQTEKQEIFEVSLSNLSDISRHDLTIYPNDIIYIEPTRRIGLLALSDFSTIFSVSLSIITFILIYTTR